MLRELIDPILLRNFIEGLGRATGLDVGVYDVRGWLLAASGPALRPTLPPLTALPPPDAPPEPQSLTVEGARHFLCEVRNQEKRTGFVLLSEGAEERGRSTAAWTAWVLSQWSRRESRVNRIIEEFSLLGDIAEMLAGERNLQAILDHIVAQTARALNCRFCSLRLLDADTGELTIKAAHNLSERYIQKGPLLRAESPIDEEALRGRVVYIEDLRTDQRARYPEEAQREGIVSGLVAGLLYRGKPVGVIRIYTDAPRRFTRTQTNLLRAVASQAASAIVLAQLLNQRLRDAEIRRQVALAGDVQARMVRTPPPRHPVLETARVFDPSSHVGGDFCDFVHLRGGRLAAVVADVSGKGVPASLLMASVRGALRASAPFCGDLGELLTRLNRHVHQETSDAEFVTLLAIAIDESGRRLGYCNAGHEPLLVLRDGEIQEHGGEGGLVLGFDEDETYAEKSAILRPNDLLLLYTDGAIDAMNFEGQHFGRTRFHEALRQYGGFAPEHALRNILWDIRRFVGLAEQSDDLTLVALRVKPDGEAQDRSAVPESATNAPASQPFIQMIF